MADGSLVNKPYYSLKEWLGIIQPGSKGLWNNKGFEVIGGFRAWTEEFIFYYWTIVFDNGELGYLGEGYGMYSIYEKEIFKEPGSLPYIKNVSIGGKFEIEGKGSFILESKYTCHKFEIEGEAYAPDYMPSFKTLEFASVDGQHVEFIEFQREVFIAFNVSYTSFAELSITNTRKYHPENKTINCQKCSKQNTLKAFPFTQSFACVHCGARYALKKFDDFIRQQEGDRTDIGPDITIGTTGIVKGIAYEVIGFALKEEKKSDDAQWKEYTLYNPVEGFAFLSEYQGNWVYARETGDAPVLTSDDLKLFEYDNKPFALFNSYSYELRNAAGEFPYNAFNDDDKRVKEFICPPEMWIVEKNAREGIIWFHGEHISRKELKTAFGDSIVLPYKTGVGAAEPKDHASIAALAVTAFAGVLLLLFTYIITTLNKEKRVLFDNIYTFDDSIPNTVSFVTPKFHLEKWRSNLQFNVAAPVDNSWFELNATLVNAITGTEYSIEKGVEYYHGYSEGEYWQEGSQNELAFLSSIPAGTYYLQIQAIRESAGYGFINGYYRERPLDNFHLSVTYDVPFERNLIICMIAFLICPFAQYKISDYYDRRRWSNSPFSPYAYED